MTYKVINGESSTILKTYPDNHFDSVVCDPPYQIGFLGKDWDHSENDQDNVWKECLRVLKPGGHLLAFSAARTYHRLATSIEDAGFEIRDQIMWIYSSGFPKSQDVGKMLDRKAKKLVLEPTGKTRVSGGARDDLTGAFPRSEETIHIPQTEAVKQWQGWGSNLKPAHEPIVMARKPLKQTIAKNCLEWGTGAINIDDTRIPFENEADIDEYQNNCDGPAIRSKAKDGDASGMFEGKTGFKHQKRPSGGENGWSRVGFSEKEVEKYKDQKKKGIPIYRYKDQNNYATMQTEKQYSMRGEIEVEQNIKGRFPSNVIGEIPDYQRYFKQIEYQYELKIDVPQDLLDKIRSGGILKINKQQFNLLPQELQECFTEEIVGIPENYERYKYCPKVNRKERHSGFDELPNNGPNKANSHPTVKPIKLMEYLIKLVTPPNGHVLDPFNGSGSTGMAAIKNGFEYTGIELDANYCEISRKRIDSMIKEPTMFDELFEVEE